MKRIGAMILLALTLGSPEGPAAQTSVAQGVVEARRLEKSGALHTAIEALEALLEQHGPRGDVAGLLAHFYRKSHQEEKEEALLKSWLASSPKNGTATSRLAEIQAHAGQLEEAIATLRSLIGGPSPTPASYGLMARLMTHRGFMEEALAAYREARVVFSKPHLFSLEIARALEARKEFEAAAHELLLSLEADSSLASSAGQELIRLERLHPGSSRVERVATISIHGPSLAVEIALAREDPELALSLLSPDIQVAPGDLPALLTATSSIFERKPSAAPACARLLERLRGDLPAGAPGTAILLRQVELLGELGLFNEAEKIVTGLLNTELKAQDKGTALSLAGSLALGRGRVNDARRLLLQAIDHPSTPLPDLTQAFMSLARAEIAESRPEVALATLHRGLEQTGKHRDHRADLLFFFAEATLHAGRPAEAAQRFRQFPVDFPDSPLVNDALEELLLLSALEVTTPDSTRIDLPRPLSFILAGHRSAAKGDTEMAAKMLQRGAGQSTNPTVILYATRKAAVFWTKAGHPETAAKLLANEAQRLGEHPAGVRLLHERTKLIEDEPARTDALREIILEFPESIEADAARRTLRSLR